MYYNIFHIFHFAIFWGIALAIRWHGTPRPPMLATQLAIPPSLIILWEFLSTHLSWIRGNQITPTILPECIFIPPWDNFSLHLSSFNIVHSHSFSLSVLNKSGKPNHAERPSWPNYLTRLFPHSFIKIIHTKLLLLLLHHYHYRYIFQMKQGKPN